MRSGGAALAFRVHQTRAGGEPVFVLLHGIGVSHRYFRRLSTRLEDAGRVVAFDLPGFGGTTKPASAVSVERYAAAIGRALDALDVGRCVLVGQSMGAQFAVELALIRPGLVSHLVLIGPVADARRRTVLQQSVALARDTLRESPSANATVFTDYLRCGPRWYLTELREMLRYPIEQRVPRVLQPLLVLRGASDPIADDAWCRRLAAEAPHGSFTSVTGRHLAQYTAPRQVAQAVTAFAGHG